jgi:hypothetical protein
MKPQSAAIANCSHLLLLTKSFSRVTKNNSNRRTYYCKGETIDATIKQAQATPDSPRDKDALLSKRKTRAIAAVKIISLRIQRPMSSWLELAPAKIHGSAVFEKSITGGGRAIFADKDYNNQKRKKRPDSEVSFAVYWTQAIAIACRAPNRRRAIDDFPRGATRPSGNLLL